MSNDLTHWQTHNEQANRLTVWSTFGIVVAWLGGYNFDCRNVYVAVGFVLCVGFGYIFAILSMIDQEWDRYAKSTRRGKNE